MGSLGLRFPLFPSLPPSLGFLEELAIEEDVVQVGRNGHQGNHRQVVCSFPLLAGHPRKEGRGRVPEGQTQLVIMPFCRGDPTSAQFSSWPRPSLDDFMRAAMEPSLNPVSFKRANLKPVRAKFLVSSTLGFFELPLPVDEAAIIAHFDELGRRKLLCASKSWIRSF